MDTQAFEVECARNRAAYERVKDDIGRASSGQYAAIAQGRLIGLLPTFDEAVSAVKQLRPCPVHFVVFPVEEEPAFELIDDFLHRL